MEHLAIMKKSWGLIPKILSGEKTVESRWYKFKYAPWDKIKAGDTVYFKDSGQPVIARAKVSKVLQFDNLSPDKTEKILAQYGRADLRAEKIMPQVRKYVEGKKYCVIVFLKDAKKVKPFHINKSGFGAMSAWLIVDDIGKIKSRSLNCGFGRRQI